MAYASLIPGVDVARAKEGTQPVCELISVKVGYPIVVDVQEGKTAKDLLDFGARLAKQDDDTVHLAGFWGLEYGWLLKEHGDLEPLALFMHGDKKANLRCILLVHQVSPFKSLKDLRGQKLALYDSASLMTDLALEEIFKKEGLEQKGFFRAQKPQGSALLALFAVRNGQADCVIVTERDLMRSQSLQPEIAKSLRTLSSSDTFPLAGLIGSQKKINALKPGLWEGLAREFPKVHLTAEGARCVRFWRFNEFFTPFPDYREQVRVRAASAPLSSLKDRK